MKLARSQQVQPPFGKWGDELRDTSEKQKSKCRLVSPERFQNVQGLRLAILLAIDQTDTGMRNGQKLDIGMLSSTLFMSKKHLLLQKLN